MWIKQTNVIIYIFKAYLLLIDTVVQQKPAAKKLPRM